MGLANRIPGYFNRYNQFDPMITGLEPLIDPLEDAEREARRKSLEKTYAAAVIEADPVADRPLAKALGAMRDNRKPKDLFSNVRAQPDDRAHEFIL